MRKALNLSGSSVERGEAARLCDEASADQKEAAGEQQQVEHIGAKHRAVAADGCVGDEEIYHADRRGVGDAKQSGGDEAEALVLRDEVEDIHEDQHDAVDCLQCAGVVAEPEHPRNGERRTAVQLSCGECQQKGAEEPGNYGVEEHRKSFLIDASGETQYGDGGDPGAGEGRDAEGQRDLSLADKVVPRGAGAMHAAFAYDQHDDGVDAEVCEIERCFTHSSLLAAASAVHCAVCGFPHVRLHRQSYCTTGCSFFSHMNPSFAFPACENHPRRRIARRGRQRKEIVRRHETERGLHSLVWKEKQNSQCFSRNCSCIRKTAAI